jgi:outer membrane lipoprotein-sorting protein
MAEVRCLISEVTMRFTNVLRVAAVAAVFVFIGQPVRAAEWADVLGKAQAACEKQRAPIKDMTITQTMKTSVPGGEVSGDQTIYQRGDKSRMEMSLILPEGTPMQKMETIIIGNGTDTWMMNSISGKRKLSGEEARQQEFGRDCWGFTPENSKLIGEGHAQGKDCWLAELSKDSVTHKLWLDKKTLLVLQGEARQGENTARWVLSDYRKVKGEYEHPYKIEIYQDDQPIATMAVQSIALNTGLSDTLFDPDKMQVQQVDMQELMRRAMEAQGGTVDSVGSDSTEPGQK